MPAVLLDTPFGFQENAREIAGRAVTYFRESLHAPIAVTGLAAGRGAMRRAERRFADERLVSDGTRRPLRLRRSGKPELCAAKVAGDGHPGPARREASPRRMRRLRERRRPHARRRDRARVRDLQVRAGPALAGGPRRRLGGGDPGGDHPSLRQQRGRDARHPFLLPGRAPIVDHGEGPARRSLRARSRRAHRLHLSISTPARRRWKGAASSRCAPRAVPRPSRAARPCRSTGLLETAAALARGGARAGNDAADAGRGTRSPRASARQLPAWRHPASTSPLVDIVREREAEFASAVARP